MFNFKKDKNRKTAEEARKELGMIFQLEFIEKVIKEINNYEITLLMRDKDNHEKRTHSKFSEEFNLKLLNIILDEKENQLKGN